MNFLKIHLFTLVLLFVCDITVNAFDFPKAEKRPVIDSCFGIELLDNYQWMEKSDDPAVKAYANNQNAQTRKYLDTLPERDLLLKFVNETPPDAGTTEFQVEDTLAKTPDDRTIAFQIVKPTSLPPDQAAPTLLVLSDLPATPDKPQRLWLQKGGLLVFLQPTQTSDIAFCVRFLIGKKLALPLQIGLLELEPANSLAESALVEYHELFRAVVIADGQFDAFAQNFTSIRDRTQFNTSMADSPYRRIGNEKPYPAVLLQHAGKETSPPLFQSLKMTARLQEANSSPHPILYGSGYETIDAYAFLFHEIGLLSPDLN